jgi:hypothetical protein
VNIKPLADRVLVRALEEAEVKRGGIIIPDTAKEKPQEGEVIAVGRLTALTPGALAGVRRCRSASRARRERRHRANSLSSVGSDVGIRP